MAHNYEDAHSEFSRLSKELLYLEDDSDFELGGSERHTHRFSPDAIVRSEVKVIRETLELPPPDLDALSREELASVANAISPRREELERAS